MSRPYVALVGRPNTGKSTLFNRLAGKRISIVEDTPGVTRDRIVSQTSWCGSSFYIIDTGGIEPYSDDVILSRMREQALLAMDMAEVIVFVTDGREGVTAADKEIASLLQRSQSKVVLAVNKIEDHSRMDSVYEFYELGIGDPIAISAEHGMNIGDLLDEIVAKFPADMSGIEEEQSCKIAVVGKPNAGKSTLVNVLLGEERVIVSEIAGTTRDAIDTPFKYEGEDYTLIDTAGIRKNAKQGDAVEYYSMLRALRAIDRSDLCVLIIDAVSGVTDQDARIASAIAEAYKAMVVVINKWDLVEKETNTMADMEKDIRGKLHFVDYAPILFMSAGKNQRVNKLMPKVQEALKQYSRRISTGLLNDAISDAVMLNQPTIKKGRSLRLFYSSQPAVKPPTFVIFVNDENLVEDNYARYLEGKMRNAFGFEGSPIKFIFRSKKTDK